MNPNEIVVVDGLPVAIKDISDRTTRAMFGMGHAPYEVRTRYRHSGDWPYLPQDCQRADDTTGAWIDERHLVCPGCGLDFT